MNIEKLNEYKKIKNLTNSQIAKITGITLSNVDKIMAGSNKNPKLDTISAICHAVGCTLDDIDDSFKCVKAKDLQFINSHEKKVISAYRENTEMQPAVDRLLGIDKPSVSKVKIDISEYTQSIAAATGKEGMTEEKFKEVDNFAKQVAEIESESK